MTTYLSSSDLSDDQVHNILTLTGWRAISGDGWAGVKRDGVNGTAWFDFYGEDNQGDAEWAGHYDRYPGHPYCDELQWKDLNWFPAHQLRQLFKVLVKEKQL